MYGGLRIKWLARVSNGKLGMGRWTQEEIDQINRRADDAWLDALAHNSGFCEGCPDHEACMQGYPCGFVKRIANGN